MKKVLSIIFSVIIVLSCLSLTAFASDKLFVYDDEYEIDFDKTFPPVSASISEDYQTLTVNGKTFSPFNPQDFDIQYNYIDNYMGIENFVPPSEIDFQLTDAQKETFKVITAKCNDNENIFEIEISTNYGGSFTGTYLRDDYFDDLALYNSGEGVFTIDFGYPENNTLSVEKKLLYGDTEKIRGSKLSYLLWFDVSLSSADGTFLRHGYGEVLVGEGKYYYADCEESELNDVVYDSYLLVHEITDKELIAKIDECMAAYDEYYQDEFYDDDYDVLYDDNATYTIAKVLLIILFAVIPLIILIIFALKSVGKKDVYLKLYLTIAGLCVAEIITFVIVAVCMF